MADKEELLVINPAWEVESQVDAFFTPLYALIPEQHHAAIENVEHNMISAVKSALRAASTEPIAPDPKRWPFSSGKRLIRHLPPELRKEVEEAHRRHLK